MKGRFTGIGTGPGDPELLTLKALRLLQQADVIAYLCGSSGQAQARQICAPHLDAMTSRTELAIPITMSCERSDINRTYDQAAEQIRSYTRQDKHVVFLCEGDPLFFGSFAYLLERLESDTRCSVVPGISSVHAASAAALFPLTVLTENMAVVSGRNDRDSLIRTLAQTDTVVIMKPGRARPDILAALAETGRTEDAVYLENIGRENQQIIRDVDQLEPVAGPYFSVFIVTRRERMTR